MALSDEERRRLEELELELAASDPDLDRQLRAGWSRNRAFTHPPGQRLSARAVYGGVAVFAGFIVVIAGILTHLAVIGVAGFLLMVAGATWFLRGLGIGGGAWPDGRLTDEGIDHDTGDAR